MLPRFLGYMLRDTMMKSTAPDFKKFKMQLDKEKRKQAIRTQLLGLNSGGQVRG